MTFYSGHRFVGVVAAAMAAAVAGACEKPQAAPPLAPEVYVVGVVQKDVPTYLDLVGQTEGAQDVDVRARVEGFLETMDFQEGTFVRRGQQLYQIDPKPFEAALAQTKADKANAEARLEKASNDVRRYTPLVAKQAVSQQELDNAKASQDAGRAEVAAAAAAVDKAQLDLGYTKVVSPVDGLIGFTKVKPGTLVGRGESTLLATVSQINPIVLRVGVTEADYLRVIKQREVAQGSQGDQPAMDRRIELTLADGSIYPQPGKVKTVERAVNAATGTLSLQVEFANPNNVVRPGQYGRARILLEMKKDALLVPQRAVQELQSLRSVAVVAGNKVEFRNVKAGPRVDSMWVIEEGLKPGDQVVAEGLQALRDGIEVRTKPMPPPGGETKSEGK
ncbi:MAG TPA: efflux RND transporter periplasmic adaptor subunit [Vicinamibacterales bacterium]|nr:efflux RND transporter periplasmic adaptor subunit [Vicinamibacterales bacterium]